VLKKACNGQDLSIGTHCLIEFKLGFTVGQKAMFVVAFVLLVFCLCTQRTGFVASVRKVHIVG